MREKVKRGINERLELILSLFMIVYQIWILERSCSFWGFGARNPWADWFRWWNESTLADQRERTLRSLIGIHCWKKDLHHFGNSWDIFRVGILLRLSHVVLEHFQSLWRLYHWFAEHNRPNPSPSDRGGQKERSYSIIIRSWHQVRSGTLVCSCSKH